MSATKDSNSQYDFDLGYDDDGDLVVIEVCDGETHETKVDELPDHPVTDADVPFKWHRQRVTKDRASSNWIRLYP